MVQPEDMPRFAGHIRSEAQRLMTLIDDIIRLSRAGRGRRGLPVEPVELLTPCAATRQPACSAGRGKAPCDRLTLDRRGGRGARRSAGCCSEVFANLCDNAIKYNVDGGSVAIHVVAARATVPVLTVSDTGIGIPAEHQSRVFERFYRVDKSHSKAIRRHGTGPVHRQARRGLSPRHRGAGQPGGEGHHLHRHAAPEPIKRKKRAPLRALSFCVSLSKKSERTFLTS